MKINTYNYTKGTKNIYDKNIMGAAIAVALAVGIGTTGVRSIVADTSLAQSIKY